MELSTGPELGSGFDIQVSRANQLTSIQVLAMLDQLIRSQGEESSYFITAVKQSVGVSVHPGADSACMDKV